MKSEKKTVTVLFLILGSFGTITALFYVVLNQKPAVMQSWFWQIGMRWGRAMSGFWGIFPLSGAELCWTLAILGLLVWLWKVFRVLIFRPIGWQKKGALYLLYLGCFGIFVWGVYTAFWAVGYRSTPFYSDQNGLSSQPVSVEDLTAVTALFAKQANAYSVLVTRNENGVFDEPLLPLFSQTDTLYDTLQQEFPALQAPVRRAKPMLYGGIMSRLGFTGFYFPFTGEANVNIHSPACMVPVTIAHELAHQRGIVFEDEANFTAIAACLSQPSPVFRYSAYLMGYIHLSNALLTADQTAWQEISSSLNPQVVADLEQNNAFWKKYKSPVSSAAEGVYEGFLQSHGEERGMSSYGACVNLLVEYYS